MSLVPEKLPGEWALEKLLGPLFERLGINIAEKYDMRQDGIMQSASRKIDNVNDGKQINLRVARDVFWNGSFTDEAICAEYFGGILASSRSDDGKNDNGIHYTDVIKSLSSKQLELHYIIYNSLNKLFINGGTAINVALSTKLQKNEVWFSLSELTAKLNLNAHSDLVILHKQGLLHEYRVSTHNLENGKDAIICVMVKPTSFGIMLYAIAHNRFDSWQHFSTIEFGDFNNIQLPQHFAKSLDDLLRSITEEEKE